MEIEDTAKCESNDSNTNDIKKHIKELCQKWACSDEFNDFLFPQKFIRIEYICEGNYNISSHATNTMQQM